MRSITLALVLLMVGGPASIGQQAAANPGLNISVPAKTPKLDLSVGYRYMRANAPPGNCGCFSLNGFYVSGGYQLRDGIGVVGEIAQGHASRISALGQDLNLLTFMVGPRYLYPYRRVIGFGDLMIGGAHGSSSYFPSTTSFSSSASSFAFSVGGGVDLKINERFAIRALKIGYLRTGLPNAANNAQNQFTLGTGFVMRLR